MIFQDNGYSFSEKGKQVIKWKMINFAVDNN